MTDLTHARGNHAQPTAEDVRVSAAPSRMSPSLAAGAEEAGLRPAAPAAHSSLRDRLAAGHDWREGARILEEHRRQVERVRASETRETGTDRHACYARRIPGTPRTV